MGSLPRRIDIEINGRHLTAIHGSVTSINPFVFATSDPIIEEEPDCGRIAISFPPKS
jgi:hypothetical protein